MKNIICPVCYKKEFKVYVDVVKKVMMIKCLNKKCERKVSFSMKLEV
jgi:hypothetical protein